MNAMAGRMLSHHNQRVFQADKLSAPRGFIQEDWQWIQDCDKPIMLEIGAGKGKHAILYADENPETQVLAIERTKNKFDAFSKLANMKSQNNLYPIHADAIAWSVHALPAQAVQAIFLLYPNPEPSNTNQQWLNMPFFEFLLSRLKPKGTITLASNITSYIDNAQIQSMQAWQLPTIRQKIASTSQRTHFEIKYLARGEACEQLLITKPEGYVTRFDEFLAK